MLGLSVPNFRKTLGSGVSLSREWKALFSQELNAGSKRDAHRVTVEYSGPEALCRESGTFLCCYHLAILSDARVQSVPLM